MTHSKVQTAFVLVLANALKPQGLLTYVEAPMQVGRDRIRIPDISVFTGGEPTGRLAEHPALLIVEIPSPSDTLRMLRQRMREFLDWGVLHIWLADAETHELFIVTESDIRQVPAL